MNKKFFKTVVTLCIIMSLGLLACGTKDRTVDLTEKPTDDMNNQQDDISENLETMPVETETPSQEPEDFEVDIVLSMLAMDGKTIDEYVQDLQKENPDNKYSVYDDTHYTLTIYESSRLEALSQLTAKEEIDNSFKEIFADEQFAGTFIRMDYDESFQNFKFYVDKEKYKENAFICNLGVGLVCTMISDTVQAYNLIPIENRITEIQYIDNETGEIITE